jgi:hypothetical protein
MKLAAKPAANDDTPLLLADDFEIDEDGFYVAELTQGTEAIDALREAATEPFIDIFSELTFTDSVLGRVTSRTGNFRIENDIWKGTEGTPLELPTPEEWLSTRAVRYDEAQTLTTEEKAQARENIGAGTGDAGIEVKSANFTAAIDGMYHAVTTLTVTDPASPVEGKGFTVFIRNGTATIGGTAYANAGSIVRRVWHSGSYTNYLYRDATAYAAASHTHVSADVTDATSSATGNTIAKRSASGSCSFSATTGVAVYGSSEGGIGVIGEDVSAGAGGSFASQSGTGLYASSIDGIYHSEFGDTDSNRSAVARVNGAFVWFRGAFRGFLQAAVTLTADRTWTLGDWTGDIAGVDATQTLTNKRTPPRVTTITSSATPTVNTDNCDMVTITALAEAATSMTSGLTGTPSNGEMLLYRIKDNGTARAITWGASIVAMGAALPTTTDLSKVLHVLFVWDSVTSKCGCISTAYEA